jgi:hypothetical protein
VRQIVVVSIIGTAVSDPADPDGDLYRNGALLPGPDALLAGPAFEEWLDSTS